MSYEKEYLFSLKPLLTGGLRDFKEKKYLV